MRQLDAEDFIVVLFEPRAFLGGVGRPLAQADDHVDALLQADALDAEHLGDVDDADAAALHIAAGERTAAGHELALIEQLDHGDVVGHEAVAALDEGQGALGFAHPAVAADDHPHALEVDGGALFDRGGGKLVVDAKRGGVHEIHRDHRRAEDGQVALLRDFQHRFREGVVSRQNQARNMAVGHAVHDLALGLLAERAQEGHLGGAEHLDAFVREILEEAGEGQGGAVDRGLADETVQTIAAGDELQLKLGAVGLEEVGDGNAVDGFGHGVEGPEGG